MKRIINLPVLTIVLLSAAYFTSCNLPAKNVEYKNAHEDDKNLNESETKVHVRKIASAEEWYYFKEEQTLKMKNTELRIADLRESMAKPESEQKIDSIFQKIVELQQKNNILRAKIISYESNQTDWVTFKREVDNDMKELDKVFHILTTYNEIN